MVKCLQDADESPVLVKCRHDDAAFEAHAAVALCCQAPVENRDTSGQKQGAGT